MAAAPVHSQQPLLVPGGHPCSSQEAANTHKWGHGENRCSQAKGTKITKEQKPTSTGCCRLPQSWGGSFWRRRKPAAHRLGRTSLPGGWLNSSHTRKARSPLVCGKRCVYSFPGLPRWCEGLALAFGFRSRFLYWRFASKTELTGHVPLQRPWGDTQLDPLHWYPGSLFALSP